MSIDNDTGAITKVEHAGTAEGSIAWKRLCETYEPETASRTAALLQEVLSYVFDEFDLKVRRYEDISKEPLQDRQLKKRFEPLW